MSFNINQLITGDIALSTLCMEIVFFPFHLCRTSQNMKEAQLNSCHPKSFSLSDLLRKVATINYFINSHNLCNI